MNLFNTVTWGSPPTAMVVVVYLCKSAQIYTQVNEVVKLQLKDDNELMHTLFQYWSLLEKMGPC
jgi:hypothetical protein